MLLLISDLGFCEPRFRPALQMLCGDARFSLPNPVLHLVLLISSVCSLACPFLEFSFFVQEF